MRNILIIKFEIINCDIHVSHVFMWRYIHIGCGLWKLKKGNTWRMGHFIVKARPPSPPLCLAPKQGSCRSNSMQLFQITQGKISRESLELRKAWLSLLEPVTSVCWYTMQRMVAVLCPVIYNTAYFVLGK